MRPPAAVMILALAAVQDAPPRAARSVHLGWSAPDGAEFYNEVRVEQSSRGSYFMVCGWNTGYFGIQELGPGTDKIALFSVWDPTKGDDAKNVPPESRVEVLQSDPAAKIGRFGGEGTGAQCKYPFPWAVGERYRFLVRAEVQGEKTAYSGWLFRTDAREWTRLATFRVASRGSALKGYYSFVEDFRRDGKSPAERRAARFGPGWVRTTADEWVLLTKARFTADATKLDTIDAATSEDGFMLSTGGETKNSTKLNSTLTLPEAKRTPPADLPAHERIK